MGPKMHAVGHNADTNEMGGETDDAR